MNRKTWRVVLGAVGVWVAGDALAQTVYNGRNFLANSLATAGSRPPDTMGSVGRDYFVELINRRYSVYRKSDGVKVQDMSLNDFATGAGAAFVGDVFDPRVLFDPHSNRWFGVTVDNARNPNSFQIFVSKTSDPTAGWRGFSVDSDTDNSHWADFPMLGLNGSHVTVSAFMPGLGSGVDRTGVLVMDKAGLLSDNPSAASRYLLQDLPTADTGTHPHSIWDMNNTAENPSFISTQTNTNIRFLTATASPAPAISTSANVSVAFMSPPVTANQPGTKANLHAGDIRFSSYAVERGSEIWAVQCITSLSKPALQWWRFNSQTKAVISSGIINDQFLAMFYPSIAVNDFGEVMIGFSSTSSTQFVSASYVMGTVSGNSVTFGGIQTYHTGVSDYEFFDLSGRNRWGDYSATNIDPCDPSTFWTIQQYVDATDSWATRVGEFIRPRPGEVRWANPASGSFTTAANWYGGAAPTSTSSVVFSRATAPGGSGYNVTLPAGTRAISTLRVHQGAVNINLGGGTLQVNSAASSVILGEFAGAPKVTINNGVLATGEMFLASSPQSRGTTLEMNAILNLTTLAIGGTASTAGGTASYVTTGNLIAAGNVSVYPGSNFASFGNLVSINGEFRLNGNAGLAGANSSLGTVVGTGSLTINAGTHNARSLVLGSLTLNGGSLTIQANAPAVQLDTLSNIGLLDLNNNDMIIDYAGTTPIASIIDQFLAGRIVVDGAVAGLPTYLAVAEAADLGLASFSGVAVDAEAVVCKFTYVGDANLDGQVDALDYERVDLAIGNSAVLGTAQGDLNYDGNVDALDYEQIDLNIGNGVGGPLGTVFVPEPAGLSLAALAVGLAARRRR
jgi:hypothetical protein